MKTYHTIADRPDTSYRSTRSETHGTTSSNGSFTHESSYFTHEENTFSTSESQSYSRIINNGTATSSSAAYTINPDFLTCNVGPCNAPALSAFLTPDASTCCQVIPPTAFTSRTTPSTSWYDTLVTVGRTSYSKNNTGSTSGTTYQEGSVNFIKSTKTISTCGIIAPILGPPLTVPPFINILGTVCVHPFGPGVIERQGWQLVTPINIADETTFHGPMQNVLGVVTTSTNSFITRTFSSFTIQNTTITITVGSNTVVGTNTVGTTKTATATFTTINSTQKSTTINNPVGCVFTKTRDIVFVENAHGESVKSIGVVTEFEDGLLGDNASAFFNEQAYFVTASTNADFNFAQLTKLAAPTSSLSTNLGTVQITVQGFLQGQTWTTSTVKNLTSTHTYHQGTTVNVIKTTVTNLLTYTHIPFPVTSTDNTQEVNSAFIQVANTTATKFSAFDTGEDSLAPNGIRNPVLSVETTMTRLTTVQDNAFLDHSYTELLRSETASFLKITTDTYTISVDTYKGSSAHMIQYTYETISVGSFTESHGTTQGFSAKSTTFGFIGATRKLTASHDVSVASPVVNQGFRLPLAASYSNAYYSILEFKLQTITDTIWKEINLGGGGTSSISSLLTNFTSILFTFISKQQHTSVSAFVNYPLITSTSDQISYNTTPFTHTLRFSFSNNSFTFTRENYPIFRNDTGGLYLHANVNTTAKIYTGSINFKNVSAPSTVSKETSAVINAFGGYPGVSTEKEVFGIFRLFPSGAAIQDLDANFFGFSRTVSTHTDGSVSQDTGIILANTVGTYSEQNLGVNTFQGNPGVVTAMEPIVLVRAESNVGSRLVVAKKYNYNPAETALTFIAGSS